MRTSTRAPGKLIDELAVSLPDGRDWTACLYETPRRGGRRIVVRDVHGDVLFDTLDCFDLGNATNALTHWLEKVQ